MAEVLSPPFVNGVEVDDFAFHTQPESPLPHSHEQTFSSPPAHPPSDETNYDFSSNIYDEYSTSSNTENDDGETIHDEPLHHDLESTRSSISSFPGSTFHDTGVPTIFNNNVSTPVAAPAPQILHHGRDGSLSYKVKSPTERLRNPNSARRDDRSGFRNPSSVRAMQMRDEGGSGFEDDLTPNRAHRRDSRTSRMSNHSAWSTTTSPVKRLSRSNQSSPQKSSSKLKKEFPLVLLHCSLLPPGLPIHTSIRDDTLLKEVLPEIYWRRWKVLQDKLGNSEVRLRGLLIPHPKAEYELLGERLLESLELERPRIRKNHFLGKADGDLDSGIGTESERETEEEGDIDATSHPNKCPDCHKKVPLDVEMERKFEVRVYAANGLMRSGAWSAAWTEMEKVDVEVSVWMPETVRREIEGRLHDLGVFEDPDVHPTEEAEAYDEMDEDRRQREVYGSSREHTQEEVDGLFEEHRERQPQHHTAQHIPPKPELQTLILNYFKVLQGDKRNLVITLLSMVVLFYALTSMPQVTTATSAVDVTEHVPVTPQVVTTIQLSVVTSTEISTTTATVTASASSIMSLSSSLSSLLSDDTEPSTLPLFSTSGTENAENMETGPSIMQHVGEMLVDDDEVM